MTDVKVQFLTTSAWLRGYAETLDEHRHREIIDKMHQAADLLCEVWDERKAKLEVEMIEPYVPKVDPRSIYARAAHVGGLGWMLKDAAHYEALVALVDYVREQERRATTGEDVDGRC